MRFRRKATPDEPAASEASEELSTAGPHDFDEANLPEDHGLIDLGGILLPPPEGEVEIRLQVDEDSGTVIAALLLAEEGGLELRPFASSRNGTLWEDVRREMVGEMTRMGGTADQREGVFGPELFCVVPVSGPEGEALQQVSRVIGIQGPRWLLRATLLGLPAAEPDKAGPWEDLVRSVVVRRGREAMPPGEQIPLTLPLMDGVETGLEQDQPTD